MMDKFKAAFPDKRILFVVDGPRRAIYNDWQENSSQKWLNPLIGEECKRVGFEFINLEAPFTEEFKKHGKRFEFLEDNHWNAYGHEVVSKVLFEYLKNTPQQPLTNNRPSNGEEIEQSEENH